MDGKQSECGVGVRMMRMALTEGCGCDGGDKFWCQSADKQIFDFFLPFWKKVYFVWLQKKIFFVFFPKID